MQSDRQMELAMSSLPILRSLLFVPGGRPELFAKSLSSGADVRVLDLEDAVPAAGKAAARALVAAELAQSADRFTFIRINHPEMGCLEEDLAVLAPHVAQAVMAPKISGPRDLEALDRGLAEHERRAGLEANAISVVVVIETPLGLRNLFDTLSCLPRVRGAGLATAEAGDLMVDLGGRWTPTGEALAYARGKFVCDARAAGARWLLDGAFMQFNDEAALRAECELARNYGFNGKIAIHPRQVTAINQSFSPTQAEVEYARRLIDAFRQAEAGGRGAVAFEGMMVDYANVRWAEQVLTIAGT
jgi:citrate lyase subunit beta/citryl-CoA lyase